MFSTTWQFQTSYTTHSFTAPLPLIPLGVLAPQYRKELFIHVLLLNVWLGFPLYHQT